MEMVLLDTANGHNATDLCARKELKWQISCHDYFTTISQSLCEAPLPPSYHAYLRAPQRAGRPSGAPHGVARSRWAGQSPSRSRPRTPSCQGRAKARGMCVAIPGNKPPEPPPSSAPRQVNEAEELQRRPWADRPAPFPAAQAQQRCQAPRPPQPWPPH